MRLFVILHGGASYSHGTQAEEFTSLAAAANEYDRRKRDSYYPCWGDPSVYDATNDGRYHAGRAWYVSHDDDTISFDTHGNPVWDTTDQYPDHDLTVGPRGGLRWERC